MLEVTTLIEGRGDGAVAGVTVVVHFVGVTADGEVFASWETGEPFPVSPQGQAGVIEGWEEGLLGVRTGERRRLVIGSGKAYGAEGTDDGSIADFLGRTTRWAPSR